MLINDQVQKQVLPMMVKATSMVTPTELEDRSAATLQLNPGQAVKAEIIANLPNSLYLARIAGEMFHVELPLLVHPGEILDLTFVSAEPRVTFQYSPPSPQGSEPVELTSLGKWLSETLRNASSPPAPEALLESPHQGAGLLAQRLKSAIVQSGLFYESHLAQWCAGALQLSELLLEPQGRLSKTAGFIGDMGDAEPGSEQGVADASTLSLVKEQLMLLNAGILSWKGEAWPGQKMELRVAPEAGEDGEPETEANLAVDLPFLGMVRVKLRFGALGLSVEIVCTDPASTQDLKEGVPELRSALVACGMHLERVAVKGEENETV